MPSQVLSNNPWSKGRLLNVLWWMTAGLLVLWGRAQKWSLEPSLTEFVTAAVVWTICAVIVTEGLCVAGRKVQLLERSLLQQMVLGSLGRGVGTVLLLGLLLAASQGEPFATVCPELTVLWSDVEAVCAHGQGAAQCIELTRCFGYTAQLSDQGILLIVALLLTAWIPTAASVAHLFRTQRIETEASVATTALAEAKLQSVRHQVNSHLVFNALNSILVAVEDKSERAGGMIMDLSQLLRNSLDSGPALDSLGNEFERLCLYLRIEKSRFEDELVLTFSFSDELKPLRCLPMTIQPLVENAIKHGFRSGATPLRVHMEAEIVEDRVRVTILNCGRLDNGTEGGDTISIGPGVGLDLLRRRLQAAFDDRWALTLVQTYYEESPTVRATVEWPVQDVGVET